MGSGLILAAFLATHFPNHTLGLVSLGVMLAVAIRGRAEAMETFVLPRAETLGRLFSAAATA